MDIRGGRPAGWLVTGWFTDDPVYRALAQSLAASLDRFGTPYELVAVPRLSGGWEANARRKPSQLLAAMDRHPDKTLVLLDVDFTAIADISELLDAAGDVALQLISRRRRNGSTRLTASSQVVVVKPTAAARHFVETWHALGAHPLPGDDDEAFLTLAIGDDQAKCSFANLSRSRVKACLSHHSAAHGRMNGTMRELRNVLGRVFFHARRTMARV